MLRNNTKYYYDDEYMYFNFNGVHSSKYNLFITNKNDLTIENTVGASSEYVSAMFQEGNYYLGTKKTQKTIKRKCAAEGLTLSQYKAMMKWLTTGTRGWLVFDNNPYWGWSVVLDTVGDATIMDRGGKLVVEFDITFKTIGTYLARNMFETMLDLDSVSNEFTAITSTCNGFYNDTMLSNEYGIPVIYPVRNANNSVMEYYIIGVNNEHQHIDYNCTIARAEQESRTSGELAITYDNITYIDIATKIPESGSCYLSYYGESNLVLCNDELLEVSEQLQHHYQPYGILQLPSIAPLPVNIQSVNEIADETHIILQPADYDKLLLQEYNCVVFTRKWNRSATYDTTVWNDEHYSDIYETYVILIDNNNLLDQDEPRGINLLISSATLEWNEDVSGWDGALDIDDINALLTLIVPNGIKSNINLPNYDVLQDNFQCYLCNYNKVSVKCNGSDQSIYVTSCNNL